MLHTRFGTRTMTLVIVAVLLLMVAACGAAATPTSTPAPAAATAKPAAPAPAATTAPAASAPTAAPAAPTAPSAPAATKAAPAATAAPAAAGVTFSKDLLPIFEKSCTRCHAGSGVRGGFNLATYAATMKGGSSGPAVVPGDPDKSPLYTLVKSGVMPFGGSRLSEADMQKIFDWIKAGALDN